MINVTIWSKDRACQLDLTLTTYKKYFKQWRFCPLHIIYKFSSPLYKAGYEIVKKLHPEFIWVEETNFRNNTLESIFNNKNQYQAFMVDDDVFVDYFSYEDKECVNFFIEPAVACFSPRMAPYINYCYTANGPCPPPSFLKERPNLWEWRGNPYDWGYPWSVASFHIFRKQDLTPIINVPFKAANSFEGGLVSNISFRGRELMSCYPQAKCICSVNNKVQTENNNRNENSSPISYLNAEFLKGRRLDPDINDKFKLNMCHGELKYEWRK